MKISDKIIGSVGLAALIFSLVSYSIQNIWGGANWVTLILGLLGGGFFLYSYYKQREKKISKRSLQYGSNILVQILIVIGIVGFLAFITTRQHLRGDWTKNKLYSLADQTDKILTGLDKEVQITAFYKTSDQRNAKDVLDEYVYRSGNLSYKFVDPDEDPQIARQFQVQQYNTVVVECGAKRETLEQLSETNLTNAIMKVSREQDKVIYFLTGHGENSITDESPKGFKMAIDAIKNENHIVRELNLVRRIGEGRGIPDSCTILAVLSPKSNLFPAEWDTIKNYIDNGGKALILLDPEHQEDIARFLDIYHMTIGNDMVIDGSGVGRLFGAGPGMPLVTTYDQSIAITKDFKMMTFYPYTSSVIAKEDKGEYDIKEILKTSNNSWAEVDYSVNPVALDKDRDIAGPVSIALLVEKKVGDKKLAIAVFGDSDFAQNGYWKTLGNSDLFLNTINYLAEEEDLITVRPKDVDDRRVTLTQANVKTIFYLVVITIPLLVVIAGVILYVRRGR
jgi:ABC-type uncharacterized transport system involved in gliding motility auxiliary subunit